MEDIQLTERPGFYYVGQSKEDLDAHHTRQNFAGYIVSYLRDEDGWWAKPGWQINVSALENAEIYDYEICVVSLGNALLKPTVGQICKDGQINWERAAAILLYGRVAAIQDDRLSGVIDHIKAEGKKIACPGCLLPQNIGELCPFCRRRILLGDLLEPEFRSQMQAIRPLLDSLSG